MSTRGIQITALDSNNEEITYQLGRIDRTNNMGISATTPSATLASCISSFNNLLDNTYVSAQLTETSDLQIS